MSDREEILEFIEDFSKADLSKDSTFKLIKALRDELELRGIQDPSKVISFPTIKVAGEVDEDFLSRASKGIADLICNFEKTLKEICLGNHKWLFESVLSEMEFIFPSD